LILTVLITDGCVQFQVLMQLQVFNLIFYCSVEPHETRTQRKTEIANECLVLISLYHFLIFFSNLADDDVKFKVGWSYVANIGILFAFNLGLMVYDSYKSVILKRAQK
jgi:hypothetical protein